MRVSAAMPPFRAVVLHELAAASDEQLAQATLDTFGCALVWKALDMHISVEGLVIDLFGGERRRRALRAELCRQLARSGSEAADPGIPGARQEGRTAEEGTIGLWVSRPVRWPPHLAADVLTQRRKTSYHPHVM